MVDPLNTLEGVTRTGHFVFHVRQREGSAWNWRLRVEVVEDGTCGVFESVQDALWFMGEHLVSDADPESGVAAEPEVGAEESEPLEEAEEPADRMD